MINGRSVLAIIPARGGSKGVPRKNIRLLHGKPLIAYTIDAARKSAYLDEVIVSTDDQEIADTARAWGGTVPFLRAPQFGTDHTAMIDVVVHVLEQMQRRYDFIVLLQPTSPMRTAGHIDATIELCVREEASSCVSVCPAEDHPYYLYEISDGRMQKVFSMPEVTRRQDLKEYYVVNGAVYVHRTETLTAERVFVSQQSVPYVMPRSVSIDIDTEEDLLYCEFLMRTATIPSEGT
jgi:CMP-N,N'-diacetyllegionaminic acid synthase